MSSNESKRKRRGLSPEDRALWDRLASSVRADPERSKFTISDAAPNADTQKASRREALKSTASTRAVQSHRPTPPAEPLIRVHAARPDVQALGRGTPGLDQRTALKLAKGKTTPDARLDLHGMTMDRAHKALIQFIASEQASGARCVLVITGKGGARRRDEFEWRTGQAGVLKSMTPQWLRQPPLSTLVVGVFQAHRRHGGDGALYVYLRKNR